MKLRSKLILTVSLSCMGAGLLLAWSGRALRRRPGHPHLIRRISACLPLGRTVYS